MSDAYGKRKYHCFGCQRVEVSPEIIDNIAVVERVNHKGVVTYECGIGNNSCVIIELFRRSESHRHKLIGNEITDKPLRIE